MENQPANEKKSELETGLGCMGRHVECVGLRGALCIVPL